MITLQGAIQKIPILLSQYLKLNDWMAPQLFRILVVAIIFSPTVFSKLPIINVFLLKHLLRTLI